MCGFSGIVHWDQEPVARDELETQIESLGHRGPDERQVRMPLEWVGLAHARLRVIDLSPAAAQPMVCDRQATWLLYNGEIYNYRSLKKELVSLGCRFRSKSDTEIVLQAYTKWGCDAFRRLDGMFALAVWNTKKQELILARDRVGKKPLFYWADGRCITFSSEMKALFAHSHVPMEVDEETLPFTAAFGHAPSGKTTYRGIRQVFPAEYLRFQRGSSSPERKNYWRLRISPGRQVTQEEAVLGLRHRLSEAVKARLKSDVPLGAFLSGGIDSSIVVGLMRHLEPERGIQTFSIGFEGGLGFDETHYAQLVSKRFHTDHTVFKVAPQSFDLVERLVWHHDQPFGDSSAIPTYLLSQLTKQHVTVALSGDGGDELFAGYVRFLASLRAECLPSVVWRGVYKVLRRIPSQNGHSLLARTQRFSKAAGYPLLRRYLEWAAYCQAPEGFFSRNGSYTASFRLGFHETVSAWWKESEGWTDLSRILHLNFKEYLPNDLMVKVDRCSMAHGLEVRSPFLDTRLIEFSAGLPDRFKIRGFQTKYLLKQAFLDLLPKEILVRKKMGFGVPLGRWFRGPWREPLQDFLGSQNSSIGRYVPQEQVQKMIQSHLKGIHDWGHQLWFLLTFEIWLRQMRSRTFSESVAEQPDGLG